MTETRSKAVLIDALPYIDKEYDALVVQEAVHALIEEEMSRFKPADYLAELNLSAYTLKFKPGSLIANEFARVSKEIPIADLDRDRYDVKPPSADKQGDIESWELACRNAKAQLQHQINRVLNLDLLGNYGTNAWLHHNKALAGMEKWIKKVGKRLQTEAENVNVQRQESQYSISSQLWNLSKRRYELSDKNLQIEVANSSVRQELKRLKVNK